ncbi:unnamed protein product [Amoebophrya sp. A25]|nr:unnamed protein product [Amoebophrya sp. A25]|eukprot:GSA25T00026830001.1
MGGNDGMLSLEPNANEGGVVVDDDNASTRGRVRRKTNNTGEESEQVAANGSSIKQPRSRTSQALQVEFLTLAESTFFLHADAENHVQPSTALIRQLLAALVLERSWVWQARRLFPVQKEHWQAIEQERRRHSVMVDSNVDDSTSGNELPSPLFKYHGDVEDDSTLLREMVNVREQRSADHVGGFVLDGDLVPVLFFTQNFINYADSKRLLEGNVWQRFYTELFGASLPINEEDLKFYCCAHFAVPKRAVLRRTASFYQKFLRYMTSYESFTDFIGVSLGKDVTRRRGRPRRSKQIAGPLERHSKHQTPVLEKQARREEDKQASTSISINTNTSGSSMLGGRIVPVATWYDQVCRYPCQHLMNFWHIMFGGTVRQRKRYLDPSLPLFAQMQGIDMKGYQEYIAEMHN